MSMQMMTELIWAITRDGSDVNMRAITIEAEDGPVFSAGHNLKELVS
jgi:enoyl-CoA hydratase/carnithine racemase